MAAGGEELDALKRQRVETTRARLALWDMTDEQIGAFEQAGAEPTRTTPILARERGVVLERNIVKGSQVDPGEMLFRLADLGRVWVVAEVYEAELPSVVQGAAVEIELPSAPGQRLSGTVDYVYPTLDAGTRTGRVRIVLPTRTARCGPACTPRPRSRPTSASTSRTTRPYSTGPAARVRRLAPGELEPRAVVLGERFDGHAVVLGIEEGERIVNGTFLIDSEPAARRPVHEPGRVPAQ